MMQFPIASLPKSLARRILPSRIWTRLRIARIRHEIRTFRPRKVRHSYGGVSIEIYLADPMAEGWYDHDWGPMAEIELLKGCRLRPGARVFDLGAHQCVVALMLAKIVGPTGQVVAVEANPHNVKIGRRNRDLNGAHNLEIVEAAAAEHSGIVTFNLGLDGQVDDGSGEWGTCVVPSLSVDDLAARYGVPDLLFVDVEGFEAKVLQGAEQTLRHCPDCFVEVHVGCGLEKFGASPESVCSFFPTERYRLFIAGQSESSFHQLQSDAPLPKERFFLVAVTSRPNDSRES